MAAKRSGDLGETERLLRRGADVGDHFDGSKPTPEWPREGTGG